jgi:hypothetical protein
MEGLEHFRISRRFGIRLAEAVPDRLPDCVAGFLVYSKRLYPCNAPSCIMQGLRKVAASADAARVFCHDEAVKGRKVQMGV